MPEYEGNGIEEEALAWAQGLLAELRASDAERWKGPMMVGTRVDNAERIAFLEQHGFTRAEYVEVNMLRSLAAPIGEQQVPPGYVVRSLSDNPAEVSLRAEAHREVWHPWTVGDVTDEQYARFMRMPGYDRDLDVVAVAPDGTIAAYVNGWLDPVNKIGDFGPVGAREAYRRQGLSPRCPARVPAPDEGARHESRLCLDRRRQCRGPRALRVHRFPDREPLRRVRANDYAREDVATAR